MSPNYPMNYSSDTSCTWDIVVSPSMVVVFELEDIDIEYDAKCAYDKLLVQEKKEVSNLANSLARILLRQQLLLSYCYCLATAPATA